MIWIKLLGNVLIVVGLAGFAAVMAAPRLPPSVVEPVSDFTDSLFTVASGQAQARPPAATAPVPPSAITRLVIASAGIDTPVVEAPLVEHDGTSSWDVPKFVAGHAEGTPNAGEQGNAVLIGHVTSLTLGNVFEHLDQVSVGDDVQVFSFDRGFLYRVTDVRDVERTDVAVLDPTPVPAITLITCSGWWLPTVHDYNQRLIVRAEAASPIN